MAFADRYGTLKGKMKTSEENMNVARYRFEWDRGAEGWRAFVVVGEIFARTAVGESIAKALVHTYAKRGNLRKHNILRDHTQCGEVNSRYRSQP